MTRRRWIADEVSANRAALTGAHADHLIRVLRAREGQPFHIIVEGVARRGHISAITQHRVEFELAEEIPAPASPDLTLLLAIFKFDRMEWAIEKCTELGVRRIIPVIARRTDSHLASAAAKRVERWRRITVQASEQSRRVMPTEISSPIRLREAAQVSAKLRIVLAETEEQKMLLHVLGQPDESVLLAIGPEGGWTEDELDLFRTQGWLSASLGPTILRAETAAIAATVLAVSVLRG